jgi:hypothetical protein
MGNGSRGVANTVLFCSGVYSRVVRPRTISECESSPGPLTIRENEDVVGWRWFCYQDPDAPALWSPLCQHSLYLSFRNGHARVLGANGLYGRPHSGGMLLPLFWPRHTRIVLPFRVPASTRVACHSWAVYRVLSPFVPPLKSLIFPLKRAGMVRL